MYTRRCREDAGGSRFEITNYGFSNYNVIRSLLSFAQRELIYERTEIGWPRKE